MRAPCHKNIVYNMELLYVYFFSALVLSMIGGIEIMNVIIVCWMSLSVGTHKKGQRNCVCFQSDGEATVYQIIKLLPIQCIFTLLKNLHFSCIWVAMVRNFHSSYHVCLNASILL